MTTPKTKATPKTVVPAEVTPEQEQFDSQIAVLNERIATLAGYQNEVATLRHSVAKLTEENTALTAERDQAVKTAATTTAQLADHVTNSAGNNTLVSSARKLAEGIKELLG